MFHKVREVKPLTGLRLLVRFMDNTQKCYDVKPLLKKWKDFEALANVTGLFEQVKVDRGGYGVSWNENLDLSCDELWENGKPLVGEDAVRASRL